MSAPALNGQIIGRAHYATRAVLESRLDGLGLTFQQSLALNALGTGKDSAQVVEHLVSNLKIDRTDASEVVDSLPSTGLVKGAEVTEAGRNVLAEVAAETARIVDRLYTGLAPEDLEVAARVLAVFTDRANAELA